MTRLTRWFSALASVALVGIVLLTVTDVLMANFGARPIIGAFEFVECLLAFVFFLGIGEIFRGAHNITVDVSDHFTSVRVRDSLRIFGAVLTVVFLVLLMSAMLAPAADAWRFGERKGDSGIPIAVLWVPALIGTLVAIAGAIQAMLRVWSERKGVR